MIYRIWHKSIQYVPLYLMTLLLPIHGTCFAGDLNCYIEKASKKNWCEDYITIGSVDGNEKMYILCNGHGTPYVSHILANGSDDRELSEQHLPSLPELVSTSPHYPTCVEKAMRNSFATAHQTICSLQKRGILPMGGSAVILAHIDQTKSLSPGKLSTMLTVANVGDAEGYLFCDFLTWPITKRHTPGLLRERQRIEAASGIICYDGETVSHGTATASYRLKHPENGTTLTMSRAIGDHSFTPYGLSSEPAICQIDLVERNAKALVLANHSIWALLSRYDVGKIIASERSHGSSAKIIAQEIANKARDRALEKCAEFNDDLSVIVHLFDL